MQVLERRGQVGGAPRPPPQKRPPAGLSTPWGVGSASPLPHFLVALAPTVRVTWMERARSGDQRRSSRIRPHLPPGHARPAVFAAAFSPTHLGTPGGARLGREGTWGGGPKGSGEAPGLEGTGGAPPRADPAGGGPGAGPRDPGRAGGTAGARRCGVGLDVGDLRATGSKGQGGEREIEPLCPPRGPAPSPVPATPMRTSPAPMRPGVFGRVKARPQTLRPAPQPALHGKPRPAKAPPLSKLRPSLQVGAAPVTRARHCPVPALLPRAPGWGALGPWGPALVPASGRYALHLQPGVVHGRGHGRADSGRVDVADDAKRLLQCVVHAQHLVSPLRLLGGLLHQCVLVPARVEVGQKLREDEFLGLRAGKERRGFGFEACTNLPAPPAPTRTWSSGMGLSHRLNSRDLPRFPCSFSQMVQRRRVNCLRS